MNNVFSFEISPFKAYSEFDQEETEFDPDNFESELTDSEWEQEMRRGTPFSPRGTTGYRQPGGPPRPMPHRPWRTRRRVWGYSYPPLFVDYRVEGEPAPCTCSAHGTEFVRWVQSSLNRVLGLRLPVTGIMDAATRSALRRFQQRHGLAADGIAGPETERALVEAKKARREKTGSRTGSAEYEELDFSEFETPQEHAQKMLKGFLDKVRNNPEDFRKLLFIAHYHPHPTMIDPLVAKGLLLSDVLDILKGTATSAKQVDDDLKGISAKFWEKNPGFQRQVYEEDKHMREVWTFIAKLLRSKGGWPFLVDASLLPRNPENFEELGRAFAFRALPEKLYQWIGKSEASSAHYFDQFEHLKNEAASKFAADKVFREEVERVRKESEQAWEELKDQAQRIQQSKCIPLLVDKFSPGKRDLNVKIKERLNTIVKILKSRLRPAMQLKGRMAYLTLKFDFEGHVDKATDPAKYGDLDDKRARTVAVALSEMLQKATERFLPLGISIWSGEPHFSGAGPDRPRSKKSEENRRVEICIRELELYEKK